MPKSTPSRRAASVPTSCPMRVILKAIFLIPSATSSSGLPRYSSQAALMTPGPDTPTESTASPSPGPWKAPAIKGLSSGALQNTTNLAHPSPSRSLVSSAASLMIRPMSATASILMPLFVVPKLMEEQTLSVTASAWGIELMRVRSPGVVPFCTRAENPPIKSTSSSFASLSSSTAQAT